MEKLWNFLFQFSVIPMLITILGVQITFDTISNVFGIMSEVFGLLNAIYFRFSKILVNVFNAPNLFR